MDKFKNWCVEYWMDSEGLIESAVDNIQTVRGNASGIIVAGIVAFVFGCFTPLINSPETARALSTVPVAEELTREMNANLISMNLHDINSRIDLKLANYLNDEQFSQELTELANDAILKLNLTGKSSNKSAFV